MKMDGLKRTGTIVLSVLGLLGGLDSIIKAVKDLKGINGSSNDDMPTTENGTDEEVEEAEIVVEAEATPVVEEEEIE